MLNYIPLKDNILCKYQINVNPDFKKKSKIITEIGELGRLPDAEFYFNMERVIVLAKGEDVNPKIEVGMTLLLSMQRNFKNEKVNELEVGNGIIEAKFKDGDGNVKSGAVPKNKDVELKMLVNQSYVMCIIEENEEVKTDKLVNVKLDK